MQLRIITPEKIIVDREVESVTLPGWEGELTVLTGHDIELVRLKGGRIFYRTAEGKTIREEFRSEEGFAEISQKYTNVFVDKITPSHTLDRPS